MADERLEAALRRALHVDADEPSAARIAALRAAAARAVDPIVAPMERAGRPRWRRVAAIAAAVAVSFAAGAAVREPPNPVRDLAHRVGLPVESSQLQRARQHLRQLGDALAEAPSDAVDEDTLRAIADADASMLAEIGGLDDEERAKVVPVAHQVHLRAVAVFEAAGRRLPTASEADLAELDTT